MNDPALVKGTELFLVHSKKANVVRQKVTGSGKEECEPA